MIDRTAKNTDLHLRRIIEDRKTRPDFPSITFQASLPFFILLSSNNFISIDRKIALYRPNCTFFDRSKNCTVNGNALFRSKNLRIEQSKSGLCSLRQTVTPTGRVPRPTDGFNSLPVEATLYTAATSRATGWSNSIVLHFAYPLG